MGVIIHDSGIYELQRHNIWDKIITSTTNDYSNFLGVKIQQEIYSWEYACKQASIKILKIHLSLASTRIIFLIIKVEQKNIGDPRSPLNGALSPGQVNGILLHIQLEVLYFSNYFYIELILLL
jgi:hypothetical protein